ncbi:MAG: hypothetical protein P8P55_06080 [Flavobacteriaceae bacterium]|jgi:hypothetical protein|nr:hypothetical protein [Flavobacteriaceae bacterium]
MNNLIFKKENLELFTEYGHGVDTIQHILHSIGYTYENIDRKETREYGLLVIKELLINDIIYVTFWGKHNAVLSCLELNKRQTMLYIKKVWNEGATHLEFEEMINFYFKEWYLKALENEGVNINTDWNWFGNEFIPNIPKWIKKNKPK